MQVAMRIDWARSQIAGTDTRILALALVSGIAGLSVAYPAVTVERGTLGEWMGRFEVTPPRLPAIPPDFSITARFHDSARAMSEAVQVSTAGLSEVSDALTPGFSTLSGLATADLTGIAKTEVSSIAAAESLIPTGELAPSRASAQSSGRESAASFDPATPLKPVRVALPPATAKIGLAGAIPPETTLDRIVEEPSGPAAASGTQPPGLFAAPKEVREFDLAMLGSANTTAKNQARASLDALASITAEPARLASTLPAVAKVPDRIVGDHIIHIAGLSLEGVPSGNLSVRVGMDGDLSIKLGDLLAPLQGQMAPDTFERLAGSAAVSEYVSFADLRAAGFDIRYDAGDDRLMVSAHL